MCVCDREEKENTQREREHTHTYAERERVLITEGLTGKGVQKKNDADGPRCWTSK